MSSEPSMEDILSSIKKIIAEDAVKSIASRPKSPIKPSAEPEIQEPAKVELADDEDIFELTDASYVEEAGEAKQGGAESALASVQAAAESRLAFDSLAQLVSKDALQASLAPAAGSSAQSIDDLVRELLRPMLKDWLDANLPDLVRNAVTREVARIAGRSA